MLKKAFLGTVFIYSFFIFIKTAKSACNVDGATYTTNHTIAVGQTYCNTTTSGSSAREYVRGIANNSIITGTTSSNNNARQYIYADAVANYTLLNRGAIIVFSGGVLNNATISLNIAIESLTDANTTYAFNFVSGGTTYNSNLIRGMEQVDNGGTAYNTTINADIADIYTTQTVWTNGKVYDTVVIQGRQYIGDSTAASYRTVLQGIDETNIAFQSINGGKSYDTLVYYGYQNVSNGGISYNTIIYNGGGQGVFYGGTGIGQSYDTIVNSGGAQYVLNGAISYDTIVNSGGRQAVFDRDYGGGIAYDTVVHSGGVQDINDSGIAHNTIVDLGGTQNIYFVNAPYAGGIAYNSNISGVQNVYATGTATDNTINATGVQNVYNAGTANNNTINSDATQNIYDSGEANTNIVSGVQNIYNNGVANTTTINSGAVQNISTNGASYDTVINGTSIVNKTGNLRGTTTINNGTLVLNNSAIGNYELSRDVISDEINMNGGILRTSSFSGNFTVSQKLSGNGNIETSADKHLSFSDVNGTYSLYVSNLLKEADNIITYSTSSDFNVTLDERNSTIDFRKTYLYNDGNSISVKKSQDNNAILPSAKNTSLASVNGVNITSILSKSLSNSVHKRLGELMWQFQKDDMKKSNSGFVRTFVENSKIKENGKTYTSLNGTEIGYDFKIPTKTGNAFFGILGQISSSDAKYKQSDFATAKGDIKTYGVGVYGLYFNESGLFFDNVIRQHFVTQNINDNLNSTPMNYKVRQESITISSEIGRQIAFNKTENSSIFITPRFEGAFSYIKGGGYTTSNGYRGSVNDVKSIKTDVGFIFGGKFKNKEGLFYSPYLKTGYIYEFDGKTTSTIDDVIQTSDSLKGGKYEIGAGFNVKNTENLSLFFDTSLQQSKKTRDIGFIFGLRYDF